MTSYPIKSADTPTGSPLDQALDVDAILAAPADSPEAETWSKRPGRENRPATMLSGLEDCIATGRARPGTCRDRMRRDSRHASVEEVRRCVR